MEETLTNSKTYFEQKAVDSFTMEEKSKIKTSAKVETPSADNDTALVQVNFILDSTNQFTSVFRKKITIQLMKGRLADILDVNEKEISLIWRNQELNNAMCLNDLVENSLAPVEIELHFMNSQQGTEKFKDNIPSVEFITVHPQYGKFENITVIIEDQSIQKKWLGGYRNKLNSIEYHHAVAQTTTQVRNETVQFHRDTQTQQLKTTGTETVMSRGTQMRRHDHYITSDKDKIVVPRSFRQHSQNQLHDTMARVIQRGWRSYCLRRNFQNIQRVLKQRGEEQRKLLEELSLEHTRKERLILTGAIYPSKRDDFYWLHLSLGLGLKRLWRTLGPRIDLTRKALMYYVVKKEVKCLHAIEKHKINHKREVLRKEEMRFLEKTAGPKVFKNKSGNLISLEDLDTQRARELMDIYSELIKKEETLKERINFLSNFRKLFSVKFDTYEYASELVSLVDREISLINLGMRSKDLKGVRMRIEQLYMNFVRQEEFNPRASQYQETNLPHTVHQKFMCVRCRKLLPASKYQVHVKLRSYSICTSCHWMQDIGNIHIDLAPYKKLLKKIRQEEIDECGQTAVSFLLQPMGMSYLTSKIWHDHSIISECNDMADLCHVRWLRDVEWAPWNTILLTAAEAEYHRCIPDVYQFYTPSFIKIVHSRHILAQHHFKELETMNVNLCSSGKWTSAEESDFCYRKYYAEDLVTKNGEDLL